MTTTGDHAVVDVDNGTAAALLAPPSYDTTGSQLPDETPPDLGNGFLLPSPLAHLVSFGTRSASHVVRLTSSTVHWGLDVVGDSALLALRLGCIVVDEGLSRAAKDAISRRHPSITEGDARANIEKTIEQLHARLDHVLFWTAASFHITNSAVAKFSRTILQSLSTLDSFFGSTDSSRTVASIIAVIRRELGSPGPAGHGETLSLAQLMMASCVLAHLQRSCRELLEEEARGYAVEEVVWDSADTQTHLGIETTMHVHLHRTSAVLLQTPSMPLPSSSLLLDSGAEGTATPGPSQEADAVPSATPPSREPDMTSQGQPPAKKRGLRSALKRSISSVNKDHRTSGTTLKKMKHVLIAALAVRAPGKAEHKTLRLANHAQQPFPPPEESMLAVSNMKLQEYDAESIHSVSTTSSFEVHKTVQRATDVTYSVISSSHYLPCSGFGETTTINNINSEKRLTSRRDATARSHRRPASIYTLAATTGSESCLISYHAYHRQTQLNVGGELSAGRRTGLWSGTFPERHLLANLPRYMRFASASYGSMVLGIAGIATKTPIPELFEDTHEELRSFARHTRSRPQDILLSSFLDPQGGSDSTGSTGVGMPLVHYISLDHESKAVVLTCRGTLDFEDILTDVTCEYDDMVWRGRTYKVHKGVHASAKRLLYGRDGRVLHTLKTALEEHPSYGLVLTGHSLGGAITSVLGIMLSKPSQDTSTVTRFVTSSEPRTNPSSQHPTITSPPPAQACLPPGRPIHVYAYGPPSTISPHLRAATTGLITTVVHGNDVVPYLSLGMLRDVQAAALALKSEYAASAKTELGTRLWETIEKCFSAGGRGSGMKGTTGNGEGEQPATSSQPPPSPQTADGEWAFATLKVLRVNMVHAKLVPPGEVYVVETTPPPEGSLAESVVRERERMQQQQQDSGQQQQQPETRVVLKRVRDVEKKFGEIRFGRGMFADHMIQRYEGSLKRLRVGAGVEVGG